jgi:predicted Zn-dependent protease
VFLPLAALFILAGCGGSTKAQEKTVKHVQGPGFAFSVPAGWTVRRGSGVLAAQSGTSVVSATTFTLLKPYDPALFAGVAAELDRNASKLAAQAQGTLTEKLTTTVAGRKVRAYRYTAAGFGTRLGFVLAGKREVQLLCRAPVGSADPDGACGLLFRSFRLRSS